MKKYLIPFLISIFFISLYSFSSLDEGQNSTVDINNVEINESCGDLSESLSQQDYIIAMGSYVLYVKQGR